MNCEICGLSDKRFYKVEIEGSTFIACSQCAKNGRIISEVTAGEDDLATHGRTGRIGDVYGEDIDLNFSSKLREAIKSKGISIEQLSRETKTPMDELEKVISGKLIPTIALTRKLEKILRIKL
ncbi:MAG: hypothetical protein OH316_00815 [Candidatus Parvarchaeota archaeon]|nr:hypothetical protein [Candidatus Parvarchaeota archaeon]MCW1301663.1 hypothetical protein [Candidatus Parvarchaeota archaeon]